MTSPQYGYIHRARVLRVGAAPGTYVVEVPALADNVAFGPIQSTVDDLAVGDPVAVAQAGATRGDLIIVGRLATGFAPDPPVVDTRLDALETRATAIENVNSTQASSITALGAANTALGAANVVQDNRLTELEGDALLQDATLDDHETRLATAESVNSSQATAISGNTTRITTVEKRMTVCTSTTRPTASTMNVGDEILETDTGYRYILMVVSAVNTWVWTGATTYPFARYESIVSATGQTLSASNTAVQFGTGLDTHAEVVASASNSVFTLARAGVWVLEGAVRMTDTATVNRFVQITTADFTTRIYKAVMLPSVLANVVTDMAVSVTARIAANTAVSVNAVSSATGSTNRGSNATAQRTSFAATWLRP